MRSFSSSSSHLPLIQITKGTFYRHHPSSHTPHPNPPFFTDLTFTLPSTASPSSPAQTWCVVGPSLSGKTTFLQLLRGQHLCLPPTARSYPHLSSPPIPLRLRSPARALRYVGFGSSSGLAGPAATTSAYLAARYESRREATDFSLRDFLQGNTQLNALPGTGGDAVAADRLEAVARDLRLHALLDLPATFLSNGQARRARIAAALLAEPLALLLDEPFMGLDPPTVLALNGLLGGMAEAEAAPRLLLAARPQDPLPEWVSHLVYLRTDCQVGWMGPREEVVEGLREYYRGVRRGALKEDERVPMQALGEMGRVLAERGVEGEAFDESEQVQVSGTGTGSASPAKQTKLGEALVEMSGVQVRYGAKTVLGNWPASANQPPPSPAGLTWTVRRGERWGVFGPNGSGKTTLVSLLCSDHPQAYSQPLRLFGRSRLPEPAGAGADLPLTVWDIQARVGHASPEVHAHMPRSHTLRAVVENAWADTFRSRPRLTPEAGRRVDAALRWFAPELDPSRGGEGGGGLGWADEYLFGELSLSAQRVLLFLRAVVKGADVVVLDEAFSGMDEGVRDKCALFLVHGVTRAAPSATSAPPAGADAEEACGLRGLTEEQALICISHVKEEVPNCVREWMCLPEANSGQPARFGRMDGPLQRDRRRWDEIWGVGVTV